MFSTRASQLPKRSVREVDPTYFPTCGSAPTRPHTNGAQHVPVLRLQHSRKSPSSRVEIDRDSSPLGWSDFVYSSSLTKFTSVAACRSLGDFGDEHPRPPDLRAEHEPQR